MKPRDVLDLLKLTGIVVLVALLLTSGLWVAGILQFRFWPMVEGAVLFSLAIGILLLADQRQHAETDVKEITFASMLYVLLFKRTALLSLFLVATVGVIAVAYVILSSLFNVEYDESQVAIRIGPRFSRQSIFYYTIQPYGWQNTGIRFKKGDKFEVFLSGQVSPGFLKNVTDMHKFDEAMVAWAKKGKKGPRPEDLAYRFPVWPFTGPEGYKDKYYEDARSLKLDILMQSYKDDDGLTVKGQPHNTVVGIVLPDGQEPNVASSLGGKNTPGYTLPKGSTEPTPLLILSSTTYPLELVAKDSGVLWITVNDADAFRWDNAGAFFLRLKTR